MEMFTQTISAVLAVYAAVAVGWLLGRKRFFDENFPAMGTKLVVNVLYPCLMLFFVLNNAALREPENLLLPPLLGFGSMVFGLWLARTVAKRRKLGDEAEQRTFAFITSVNNYGYIPIPLCAALFDAQTAGVLLVFTMGMEAAVWTFGPLMLAGRAFTFANLKGMVNPVLIALCVGIVLNLCHAVEHAPVFLAETLMSFVKLLGNAAIPLALVMIGATLCNVIRQMGFKRDYAVMGWGCLLRLGVVPAVMMALAWIIPMPVELRRVLIVEAAMPCGIFPILMCAHYGGKPTVAIQLAVSTSLLALLTTPLWLVLGMKFILPDS